MGVTPELPAVLRATTVAALRRTNTHDAIIVGAGAAGGMAAMLLAESGLNVLVLDAGPSRAAFLRAPLRRLASLVPQLAAKVGGRLPPALIPAAAEALKLLGRWRQPVQSQCYAWPRAPYAFVDDRDCPYITPPDRPFLWLRARILGGRLVVPGHGRQYYRLGPHEFSPVDGLSPAWPLRPNELDPWYGLVEHRLGLSGMHDGVPWLPDSELKNLVSPSQSEVMLRDKIVARWPGVRPIVSRYAPPEETLEEAACTGRLQCRQGAIVREIRVDGSGNVCGVVWIDEETRSEQQSSAPLVFLCASALESTRLLMLSRSHRGLQGLGATSGVLGHCLMDHVYMGVQGFRNEPLESAPETGRCLYLPRFDARASATPNPGRGCGVQVYQFPAGKRRSHFLAVSFGEMLPRQENRVTLDTKRTDAWGIPVLRIDCAHEESDLVRARDQIQALRELAELAEVELTEVDGRPRTPGTAAHECGTARMGTDPASSVLDANNQCWDARGLYVTDAACFPSQGSQNPTLTILALTARACHHALGRKDRGLDASERSAKLVPADAPPTSAPVR
jgi:choline dehydrogenase-like flavoprotein